MHAEAKAGAAVDTSLGKKKLFPASSGGKHFKRHATNIRLKLRNSSIASAQVARDENELITKLEGINSLRGSQKIESFTSCELVKAIREFIDGC